MDLVESERVELKSRVTARICKTVIAFANGIGGSIYIGIDDFGRIVGVEDIDEEMLRLSNLLTDDIYPEVMQLVSIEPVELEGKMLIKVDVEPGPDKPYYLKSKGLVPSGVYVRLGPATVPMSRNEIRRMIRNADGLTFEAEHCKEQDLTFEVAKRVFSERGVPFEDHALRALGIIGADGFYTNLALLISDQNPFDIRCAIFNDDAFVEFVSRIDCQGSIFKQIEDAEAFLNMGNALRSYFPPGQLQRIDKRDYPPEVIREGILNSVIHREYDLGASTLIKMNRTKLRISNFGGLYELTLEQALSGYSKTRNKKLQQLIYRLDDIEALGTGLQKIMRAYEPEGLAPTVEADAYWFALTLPNINTTRNPHLSLRRNDGPNLRGNYDDYVALDDAGMLPPDVSKAFAPIREKHERDAKAAEDAYWREAAERILGPDAVSFGPVTTEEVNGHTFKRTLIKLALTNNGSFTRQEAEQALGTNRDVTLKVINGMLEEGALTKEGKARATRYHVATG